MSTITDIMRLQEVPNKKTADMVLKKSNRLVFSHRIEYYTSMLQQYTFHDNFRSRQRLHTFMIKSRKISLTAARYFPIAAQSGSCV